MIEERKMNKDITLLKQSIAHYKRMQRWVKKCIKLSSPGFKDEIPTAVEMYSKLGESWKANSCSLCAWTELKCMKCPLYKRYGRCDDPRRNAWLDLHSSKTWEQWLKYSNKLVHQLNVTLRAARKRKAQKNH